MHMQYLKFTLGVSPAWLIKKSRNERATRSCTDFPDLSRVSFGNYFRMCKNSVTSFFVLFKNQVWRKIKLRKMLVNLSNNVSTFVLVKLVDKDVQSVFLTDYSSKTPYGWNVVNFLFLWTHRNCLGKFKTLIPSFVYWIPQDTFSGF